MEHWAAQYEHSNSGTLENKIYLAACYILLCTEDKARAIGAYAIEHKCSIWHANWALGPRTYRCACAPCSGTGVVA
jgi:hypothetical protein